MQPVEAAVEHNITYRQLLSNNLGVRDPLRVIALCDSDAFYAACEMVRLGVDKETPLVVLQWDSLIAVNYPARTYGISRMCKLKDALKLCPHLRVVHVATYKEGEKEPGYWDDVDTTTHKVSLDYYRRESAKVHAALKENLPGAEIEKASIDEAFIDLTRPCRARLLDRYPYLATVPPNSPKGSDSPLPQPPQIRWDGPGSLVPVNDVPAMDGIADVHAASEDDVMMTWHDVVLSIAAEMMAIARTEVHSQLGYTTSAGIARNKFLAKLCASYKKPMNQTILRDASIPNYLRPMSFQKIRFLGGKLGEALAKEFDASTVGDLLHISLEEMQRKFGENAIWVHEVLRGIDRSEVKEKPAQTKSMLASKNLPQPITNATEGRHWIRVLAAELALRLNNARKVDPTLWPKSIVLHARRGYDHARSRQAPFPFKDEVTVDLIASAGDRLWKDLVGAEEDSNTLKISSLQLAFSGLGAAEKGQKTIEGFLKTRDHKRRNSDTLRQDDEGMPASISVSANEHMSGSGGGDGTSFTCPRCGRRLSLTPSAANREDPTSLDLQGPEIEVAALEKLKMEHADFHFAQDLAKMAPDETRVGQEQPPRKTRKKLDDVGSITKYLVRR